MNEHYEHNRLWYIKTYNNLIFKGKSRGLDKSKLDYYTEKHHIVPKCIGGLDIEDNYVLLTAREHIISHMLLACIYPDNIKLVSAVLKMFSVGKTKRDIDIKHMSTRLIAYFKEEASKLQLGKIISEEHRNNLSLSHKGKKLSDKTKNILNTIRFKVKIIGPDGSIYESISNCSSCIGVPETTLKNWIYNKPEKGYSIVKENNSLKRNSKNIKVKGPNGEIYNSIRDCARSLNRSDKTIKNWIEKHPELGYTYL